MAAGNTRSGTRSRRSRASRNHRQNPTENASLPPAITQSLPTPTALTLPKRRLRRSWEWLGKYSNSFILLVAILALIGVLPADSQAAANVWRQIHPAALSDQAKVALAETWASTYLNDGQGASSKTWLADPSSDITPAISASAGLLAIGLKPGSGGGYSFVLDTAQNANLPTGNWFLSMEPTGPPDCEYGITFNAEQTTARLAWLYVDTTQTVSYGLQVLRADGTLADALPEVRYNGPVDSLGIVHYANEYIMEINGKALRSTDAGVLTKVDKGVPLAAPGIGVGMFTCGGSGIFQFQFSNLQLQVPRSP
jgi:hypothetical protein